MGTVFKTRDPLPPFQPQLDPVRLRHCREAAGLTQADAGRMVGIEQHPGQYWCHYEKGKLKTPRKDTLDRMAKALNVPVEMLLVDSPAPLPPIPDPLPRPTDAEMEAIYQAGYEAGYLAGMTEGMARGGRMASALARVPPQAPQQAPTLPEAVAELTATVDAAAAMTTHVPMPGFDAEGVNSPAVMKARADACIAAGLASPDQMTRIRTALIQERPGMDPQSFSIEVARRASVEDAEAEASAVVPHIPVFFKAPAPSAIGGGLAALMGD